MWRLLHSSLLLSLDLFEEALCETVADGAPIWIVVWQEVVR